MGNCIKKQNSRNSVNDITTQPSVMYSASPRENVEESQEPGLIPPPTQTADDVVLDTLRGNNIKIPNIPHPHIEQPKYSPPDPVKQIVLKTEQTRQQAYSRFFTGDRVFLPDIHPPLTEEARLIEADSFSALIAKKRAAAGNTFIAEEIYTVLDDLLKVGIIDGIDPFAGLTASEKSRCIALFASALRLLACAQQVRTNLDSLRIACTHHMQNRALIAKPYLETVAIWALQFLKNEGEVLLPIDYQSRSGFAHSTLLLLRVKAGGLATCTYFETQFCASRSIPKDLARKLQHENTSSLGLPDRGRLITPETASNISIGRLSDRTARIFAARTADLALHYLEESRHAEGDVRKFIFLLAPDLLHDFQVGADIDAAIAQHLASLGEWRNSQQRLIRLQNPYSCELTSLKAFWTFFFQNEVAHQVLRKACVLKLRATNRLDPIRIQNLDREGKKTQNRLEEALQIERAKLPKDA